MLSESITEKKIVNRTVATKLAEQEYNKINELVADGLYLSSSDFVREAIRDKLRSINEITLRDIPSEQQKNEIIEYARLHGVVDAIEIADALRLDAFDVDDIMTELINEGILEEVK